MIIEYHRPDSLPEALKLLARTEVDTVPLGGGTVLNQPSPNPIAVIDLQNLGLNTLEQRGKKLMIGATVTLQQLHDYVGIPTELKKVIYYEATYNLRQMATVPGVCVAADGRSPFVTTMLALGADLTLLPGDEIIGLGDFLPLRQERKTNSLITQLTIPTNIHLAFEYVARTPADLPIVCVAVAQWTSGRTRLALGGYGRVPLLAMDGPESTGAEVAGRDAYHEAGDKWASADYRSEVAATLTRRALHSLKVIS
jgi:CO/xanthine dehydrogenase FAD-binding subunit